MKILDLFLAAWRNLAGRRLNVPQTHRHRHNPPGAKLLRQAYKANQGRRGTYREARKWYGSLDGETLREKDARTRERLEKLSCGG